MALIHEEVLEDWISDNRACAVLNSLVATHVVVNRRKTKSCSSKRWRPLVGGAEEEEEPPTMAVTGSASQEP